jgi:hypothetical protein
MVFARLGAVLGAGCDAPALPSVIVGASLEGFLGLHEWRGLLIIAGALAALISGRRVVMRRGFSSLVPVASSDG